MNGNTFLQLIEKDARLTEKQLSIMLEKEEGDIKKLFEKYENDGTILGYRTIIDWDKTSGENVSALIELKLMPQKGKGFAETARRICNFDEVKSVYLMSGGFDLALLMEGKSMRDIAFFVAERLATIENVTSTATHFVLQKYKDGGIIFGDNEEDKRGNNANV